MFLKIKQTVKTKKRKEKLALHVVGACFFTWVKHKKSTY